MEEQKSQNREEMITSFLTDVQKDTDATRAEEETSANDVSAFHSEDFQENGPIAAEGVSALIAWEGPEFESYERDQRWYVVAGIILLLIVTYAVIVNSPIMAITFILIGLVGYIYLEKDPRDLVFSVAHDGIYIGTEFYSFQDIESFWIFYEPPHTYTLSITLKSGFVPYIHIPLHQVDPTKLRRVLLAFLPERQRELTMVDTIERLLHI